MSNNLTNQEFLQELEKRLPSFTHNEMRSLIELTLMNIPNDYKEKLLQVSPQQANDWMKKSIQQVEKKKIDKLTEELKKSLEKQSIHLQNTMPKSKKLQKKIENKLAKLSKLLDKIDEAQVINSDDPDTWDSEVLYNLVENLKEALALLEDKESEEVNDNFGQSLILEEGLCSLVDSYQEEEGENEDF